MEYKQPVDFIKNDLSNEDKLKVNEKLKGGKNEFNHDKILLKFMEII